ncbi:MAG TPA: hypothetical protein VLZ12_03505 [Verrucomicrobiae bacterium]|nr:hypothetical protein [Verrucomicrobiae bacterium]
MKRIFAAAIATIVAAHASAAVLSNTTANGVVYMTYDRAAWATIAPYADYTDIHSNPTGLSGPSADADGQRWIFPDRIEGTNWVAAAYPSDYLTPIPDHPLEQPAGGFVLPVNSYVTNSFAANHQLTAYNSTTNPNGFIGLGGSMRATSDFNEPGASVWWEHLAIMQDAADSIWKLYATSGPGQGSIFELTNVVVGTVNGNLHLSADYIFGNTDWLLFFQDYNGRLDPNAILGHIELIPAGVAKVVAGKAVIHYSQSAWEALASGFATPPVLTLSAFFNQVQANALTQSELLSTNQSGASYSNQIYALNGETVTNLPSRYTQPTTFLYPRGNLTNHVGKIGLGGVARFAVLGGAYGNLLYGDYTLQYNTNRFARDGSGWYLYGNIPPAAPAFDLANVNITETTNSFVISADLSVSWEVANLLYSTPSDAGAIVGTFKFTGYTAALTTPVINQVTLSGTNLILRASNGLPDSVFSMITSTNLALPVAEWSITATGVFDGSGTSSNSISVNPAEPARFFRILQP